MAIMATLASVAKARAIRIFIGRSSYQPLADSGATMVLLRGFVFAVNTKTDLTNRRSVALVAPPHPKCPFQVGLRRVRAS